MQGNHEARFHEILNELGALHTKKGHDYGREQDCYANVRASQEWGVKPWVGALIRATDKLRRLQTYAQKGTLANEGVEDSLRDLAVYAIISLVLWEEERGPVSVRVPVESRGPDWYKNMPRTLQGQMAAVLGTELPQQPTVDQVGIVEYAVDTPTKVWER